MLNFDTHQLNELNFNTLMNSEYHKLLNGELYYATIAMENVSAGTYYIGIDNNESHVIAFDTGCSDKLKTELYEESDFSGGTGIALLNRNRNNADHPEVIIFQSPTVNSDGTLIASALEGTEVSRRIGNSVGLETENTYVLKPNVKYLVKLTTYATADISIILNIFEEY